jgi:hypothetical protein
MNGVAIGNHERKTIEEDGPEPFAKCQRYGKREADLTTAAGGRVCAGSATPDEIANGSAG